MTEKIMIINGSEVITVDGSRRNLVKKFEVELHSSYEIAKRAIARHEKENYNRIIVNTYGVGSNIGDELIKLFEQSEYDYDIQTGVINNKSDESISKLSDAVFNIFDRKEEF